MNRIITTILLSTLLGSANAYADKPVVAVLYFDNNTGDKELDVLQKGLADMMVTDLASVKDLVVVEREKLEAVLDELKLQRTRYFDQKTAVKIGKGLGAKYAVTGAMAAMKPKMRIDIRLVEIATAKVVVADRVIGEKERFFELQQQLVDKFVAGLNIELSYKPSLGLRVPNVDTLLEYSKGVDLADQGKVDEAKAQLRSVIKASPMFGLARTRISELQAGLTRAKARRTDVRADAAGQLQRQADAYLESNKLDALEKDAAENYLGFRMVKGAFIARALQAALSQGNPGLVLPSNQARAVPLMKAYAANLEALVKEYDAAAKRIPYLSPDLPRDAQELATAIEMKTSFGDASRADADLAQFLLVGDYHTQAKSGGNVSVAPPLAILEPKFEAIGFKLFERAKKRGTDYDQARAREELSEAYFLRGDLEKAVGALQDILDTFPTHGRYKFYEGRIQELLGMKRNNHLGKLARYNDALEKCGDMDFRIGVGERIDHRMRLEGIDAIERVLDEVIAKCKDKPKLENAWQYIFQGAASTAAKHGDCSLYEKMIGRFIAAGGRAFEIERMHEHIAPQCKNLASDIPKPVCWMLDMSGMKPDRGFQSLRKAIPAAGLQTAPKGLWYADQYWFGSIHPRQDKKSWDKCRAIIKIAAEGTPDKSTLEVSVVKGKPAKSTKIRIGKIQDLEKKPSVLAPAWKLAWAQGWMSVK